MDSSTTHAHTRKLTCSSMIHLSEHATSQIYRKYSLPRLSLSLTWIHGHITVLRGTMYLCNKCSSEREHQQFRLLQPFRCDDLRTNRQIKQERERENRSMEWTSWSVRRRSRCVQRCVTSTTTNTHTSLPKRDEWTVNIVHSSPGWRWSCLIF